MLIIIILLIAAFNLTSSAPVLPSTSDYQAAVPVTIFGRELPETVNTAHDRSVQDIVLSCLATILACTWVAVHPDVPPPTNSKWNNFRERVAHMAVAVLTPELIIGNAGGEWRLAIKHAVTYNQKHHGVTPPSSFLRWYFTQDEKPGHWTITHGFLLEMRGLVDDSGKVIRSAEEISEPLDISMEEINDKSKGDFLTKALVVLQTSWFIFQCLARWTAHLPVTELEVTTFAYAILNIGTYAIWWNKPQGMGLALRMSRYKMSEEALQQKETAGNNVGEIPQNTPSELGSGENSDEARPLSTLSNNGSNQQSGFLGRVAQVLELSMCRGGGLMGRAVPPFLSHRLRSSIFGRIIAVISRSLVAMLSKIGRARTYVPIWVFSQIVGTVFGSLHLIPLWSSSFPSPVEKLLWKGCAILVTVYPSLAFCVYVIVFLVSNDPLPIFWLSVSVTFIPYAIARTILLVVALTTLRGLPPDAFRDVAWTTFIPHL